jgi:hypothetical protein
MKWVAALCAMLVVATAGTGSAAIPATISYQGVLTDADGSVVSDGDYDITFTLYDAETEGNVVWTDTQLLPVADGVFDAVLGSGVALDPLFDQPYWLGIAVEDDPELTPRIELTAAPYAFRAAYADSAQDSDWVISGSDVYRLAGNVGIGVEVPLDPLHVEGSIRATGLTIPTGALDGYVLTSDPDGIATWQAGGTGDGDITAVDAGQGLAGGGTEGAVLLDVGAGDGIEVSADTVAVRVEDFAGEGLADDGSNNLDVLTGAGLEITADTLKFTAPYEDGSAYDAVFVNEAQADAITADMVVPDVISSLDGVTNDAGDIDLIEGENITITPDDVGDAITISATGGGDVGAVYADAGLAGGGESGDLHLEVGAGDGITVTADSVAVVAADIAGDGLRDDGANDLAVNAGTGLEVVADTLGLTSAYEDGSAYDAVFVNEAQADAITMAMIAKDVLGSLDGVSNDGGNIDLIEGSNIQIISDDTANTITIAAAASLEGDITAVYGDNGLTGGSDFADVHLAVGAGDGIDVTADSVFVDVTDLIGDGLVEVADDIAVGAGDGIEVTPDSVSVSVSDFAGAGLADDGANNLDVVTGTGLEVVADTLGLTVAYQDGSAYDTVFVNEAQADAVTADMVVPDVVSSLDGVANDAGDIDLIEGDNITITPDDEGNTITIAAVLQADADWTISDNDMYSNVSGNVGVGTETPAATLHVAGDARVDSTLYANKVSSMSPLELQTGDVTRIFIDDVTGNVGVGTAGPSELLDVDGTARMAGLEMTTDPSAGHVMVSDATGAATWESLNDILLPFSGSASVSGGGAFTVTNTTPPGEFASALQGLHTSGSSGYLAGDGFGVFGFGASGNGVLGTGSYGVRGTGSIAGVYGVGSGAFAAGVWGENPLGRAGYFDGSVYLTGFELPTDAVEGYVLTSNNDGNGTWQALPPSVDGSGSTNRIPKFTGPSILGNSVIVESGGNVTIGEAKDARRRIEVKEGDPEFVRSGERGVRFTVFNEGGRAIWGDLYETNNASYGRAGVYAYRDRPFDLPAPGVGLAVGSTNNALTAYNHWGDDFTFGIAGYSYNDEKRTGGVIGAKQNGSYWASLGYRDENYQPWGVYTPNNTYVGGLLGVGTDDPQEKLDVVGTIQATGLKLPTGAAGGYILTSDVAGEATWQAPTTADVTAVYGDDGLTGGGDTGDVYLAVGAGDGIAVAADDVSVVVADFAGAGLADDGSNNLDVNAGTGLEVVADTLGLTAAYEDGSAYDAVFVNEGQADAITADMVTPDVVTSVDGVVNDAGDIDLIEGANITITPDDIGNTITIAATSLGDVTAVAADDGLTGGGDTGDLGLAVGAGDGISVSADAVAVAVADFAGAGLVDDGGNNIDIVTGAGLEVVADTLRLTAAYEDGSAYDAVFVNESQADAVSAAMISPNIVASIDGVSNDGGNIDLVEGTNITITPNDGADTITIAADNDGDWTLSGSDMYAAVSGNVGIGTSSPARKLHISDVLRLEPVADFPSSPSDGDIVVKGDSGSRHIYCYLNGSWAQLD